MKKDEIVLKVFLDHRLGIWWSEWARKLKWFCASIGRIVTRERETPEACESVSLSQETKRRHAPMRDDIGAKLVANLALVRSEAQPLARVGSRFFH